jgi:pantoate--beta-alanine ligase
MRIIKTTQELQTLRRGLSGTVGFVPTMGALHQGHLSLIQQARRANDHLIVSIFVNPTQFLEGEDLQSYPRKEEADIEICRLAEVDILFMPTIETIYARDELKILAPARAGFVLEGQKRAGHFDGMLQVVMKLLNLTRPTHAYFGKKDAQQLSLIIQMVKHYFLETVIVPCDIVRDAKGLALSSRNLYLSSEQKRDALALSRSLRVATELVISGTLDAQTITQEMLQALDPIDEVEYVAVVNRSFEALEEVVVGESIILVAGWVGRTRLIDNLWI